jgi:ABC-type Co2+ transport system permease subunit|tara:strand:+ start:107 stop:355 length:249 start_codon:yes stop_codon:yes gene_type:complete
MFFDFNEVLRRLIKYFIEGFAVAVVAYCLPKQKISMENILVIALTAAATFAILDMFTPSIGGSARMGAGFGVGANLVGFPGR